jgi:hypothetical protein
MSAIHLNAADNLIIITTATHNPLWRDHQAEIQVKTPHGHFEIRTNNVHHLILILDAIRQLRDDIEDIELRHKQIKSRVFDFIEDTEPFEAF